MASRYDVCAFMAADAMTIITEASVPVYPYSGRRLSDPFGRNIQRSCEFETRTIYALGGFAKTSTMK